MQPDHDLAKLTPRERQCLGLLADLYNAKDQAAILKLSPRTIENYLASAARKLKVRTSRDAARLYRVGTTR